MNTYSRLLRQLKNNSYTCQVTGVAGHQHDLEYCQQTCHGIHYVLTAVGDRTTLNSLFNAIQSTLTENGESYEKQVVYRDFKLRDVGFLK